MNRSKFLVLLFAFLLMTGSVYAIQGPPFTPMSGSGFDMGAGDGGAREGFKAHHPNLLNLTPEQKGKLKEIMKNFRKETIFLRNDLKVKRLELRALWTVPRPEKDKIVAKQKEIIDLTTQLKMKAIDFRLAALSVLTPEQAAQVGMWGPKMWHRGHMKKRIMER
jgi:Spy/CpxP family protein refolding chaperone